jgi:hypothetical protein
LNPMLPAGDGLITEQRLLTETEDAFPTLRACP